MKSKSVLQPLWEIFYKISNISDSDENFVHVPHIIEIVAFIGGWEQLFALFDHIVNLYSGIDDLVLEGFDSGDEFIASVEEEPVHEAAEYLLERHLLVGFQVDQVEVSSTSQSHVVSTLVRRRHCHHKRHFLHHFEFFVFDVVPAPYMLYNY